MLPYDARALADLLLWQEGVVSRRQLLDLGARPHDVRRLLRRRDLNVVWPGTYVDHTGPLTQDQRAWAAVLHFAPAALCLDSALPRPDPRKPIHVAVALDRSVRPVEGVRVHRMAHLDLRRHPTALPPRVRVEHAAIDVALAQRDTAGTFRVLADVCQTRQTTAPLIAAALRDRPQVPHRGLLLELLDDLEAGACSVLEREYLRLERVHGLPTAHRQRRDTLRGRAYYRDVPYDDFALDVELDGRAFHDTAGARAADLERDLDTVVDQATLTVRLGYAQVFTHGCRTIAKVATLLQKRGWAEDPVSCPDCSRNGATR
ncbi:hypothetical protein [Nocardioides sp.]|uniref:hypothetical protein n=1 Tax=Nocardioides sp. TaxID=35761 RepID=UPI002B267897|nr:hypothetical protein [Nocardioides sp.]